MDLLDAVGLDIGLDTTDNVASNVCGARRTLDGCIAIYRKPSANTALWILNEAY